MNGMDMGTATQLGSFGSFIAVWVVMMAAMMLPTATPARPRCCDNKKRKTHNDQS
jgi:predicted metal-binding membrane protein